ncbi:uncharacterized protein TRUGW13939_03561 [Talaromyces rugulosus]|uniref:DUF2293 domain-containing protein n=1 Tax=Talaromyces rugulosus TaxID=121627 RepID=A0A7H8QRJ1_TALRU|nr:uncharacterized protein TRUGW13939_03561 [Talaromyces rugulosus]QKX56456.1 hypothetical protein TRUGW13939_03561 [Talaromyces rugulosus]
MTRIQRQPSAARAQNGLARAKFRKHKVIMESITQKRKKLRSIIYFEAEAPPGYTFISAGNPKFTSVCKEMCRKHGLQVFAVTTTPHQNTHGLSQQVHRVGYHFPSTVVATACMELGFHLTEKGNVLSIDNFNTASASCRSEAEFSQTIIDKEARDVIRDLFPNIPDDDTDQIIKTAFQKGQRKVGTAAELPLARRAQLAVVAHIRHIYTEYDQLLKKTSFQEARRRVEDSTLERLVQWRGEDENGMPELEDVFREVIIISDDEDEDDEGSHSSHSSEFETINRDPSVEILSSKVITDRLEAAGEKDTNLVTTPLESTGTGEFTGRYTIVQRVPAQKFNKSKVDRRGFNRYQAWDRAMGRYREGKSTQGHKHDPFVNHGVSREGNIGQRPLNDAADERLKRHHIPIESPPLPRHQAPDILHFPDGSIFSKIPPSIPEERVAHPANFPPKPLFVAGPRFPSHRHDENPRKRIHPSGILATNYDRDNSSFQDNTILTSIEHPEFLNTERPPVRSRANDSTHAQRGTYDNSTTARERPFEDLSRRIDVINLDDDSSDHPKRRRLEPRHSLSSIRRPSSCGNDDLFQRVEKPQLDPRRYVGPILDDNAMYRVPAISREATLLTRGNSEQTVHTISRSRLSLERPSMEVIREPSENFHREDGLHIVNPRLDTHRPNKVLVPRNNGYMVEPSRTTTNRETHRLYRPSPGHGSDSSGWWAKANSYETQREIINNEDPLRAGNVHSSQLHPIWPQLGERNQLGVPHNQVDSRSTSRSSKDPGTRDWTPPASHQLHSPRPTSQNSVFVTQKKKDTLPVSAIRRYEVQLEKSRNY